MEIGFLLKQCGISKKHPSKFAGDAYRKTAAREELVSLRKDIEWSRRSLGNERAVR